VAVYPFKNGRYFEEITKSDETKKWKDFENNGTT
jgi:hypothetical protein